MNNLFCSSSLQDYSLKPLLHNAQKQVCTKLNTYICDEILTSEPHQPKPSRLTSVSQLDHSLTRLSAIKRPGMAAQPLSCL